MKRLGLGIILSFSLCSISLAAFTNVDCTSPADLVTLGGITQTECEFLEDIYTDTVGANWTTNTNWDTLSNVSSWYGVNLNVTNLDSVSLANNNLVGNASSWVLPNNLNTLALQTNSLTGDISGWVLPAGMTNSFSITGNSFSGDISGWVLPAGMTNIFDLSANSFSGDISGWIPPTGITQFRIFNNSLTGDISAWTLPTNPTLFQLTNNSLSGDLSGWDVSAWSNTTHFQLGNNSFSGDLSSWNTNLAGLTSVTNFDLSLNSFTGDIGSWVLPTSLVDFRILSNSFTGDISSWILPTGLQQFYIRLNGGLSGDISSWVLPTGLINFQVYGNDLSGDISGWVLPTNIFSFMLQNNNFAADISGWALPAGLRVFLISNNAFFGDIPDFTTVTALLTSSNIDKNQFTIPSALLDAAADSALGEDWSATQTIAPTNPGQSSQGLFNVVVTIDPYEYASVGNFNVRYSTVTGGPYSLGPVTTLRSAGTDISVTGLVVNTPYYGVVEAETPANSGGNILTATSTEFFMLLQGLVDLEVTSDTGVSSNDNITSDTTPTFVGTCVTGAGVDLYINGVATGDGDLCVGGTFSITPAIPLVNGSYNIQTTQTVGADVSSLSLALPIVVDDTSPILTASADTLGGIDDPTINFSTIETGSGIERFEVEYLADNNAVGLAGANTIDILASTATSVILDLDPDELIHEVILRAYDNAGNVTQVTLRFPPLINIAAPTVVSNSTINDTTFTVTSPAGNNLESIASTLGTVNCDGSGNGTGPFTSPVSCVLTGITTSGTATITGNDAVTAATGQAQQSYVVDSVAPVITITDDLSVTPTQSDSFEVNITDDNPDATAYEYGFSADAVCDGTDVYGNSIVSNTAVVFNTEANNGQYLCVVATDLAGNTSYQSSVNPLNIDVTDPIVSIDSPTTGFPVFSDGSEETPGVERTPVTTVSGTGEDGDSILVDDGNGNTCSTVVASGMWSCDVDVTVPGATTYSVTETDVAGNTGTDSVTVDVYLDSDGDGHPDDVENTAPTSNPNDDTSVPVDSDGDGVPDNWETGFASPTTDPNDGGSTPVDTDGDGHPDYVEIGAGSDPNDGGSTPVDTDGDLVPDWVEIMQGTNENDITDYLDPDGDLVPSYVESIDGTDATNGLEFEDADGDLVPDYVETIIEFTNPNDQNDFLDTDGGGAPDYFEVTYRDNYVGLTPTIETVGNAADDTTDTDGDKMDDYTEIMDGNDPLTRTSTSGGGTATKYCRDPEAINYREAGAEDNRKCIYEEEEEEVVVVVEPEAPTEEETEEPVEEPSEEAPMEDYTLENDFISCPIVRDINNSLYNYAKSGIFTDENESVYKDEILKFKEIGVVDGYGDGSFKPYQEMTRTEFLKVALISHCYEYRSEDTSDLAYTDVDKTSWQARVIKKAEGLGMINGDKTEDGTLVFRPDDIITKAEAVKILMRLSLIEVTNPEDLGYTDITTSWHEGYIQTGQTLGLFNPDETSNRFYPDGGVKREDMVHLITNLVHLYR